MKKIFVFFVLAIFTICLLPSCNQPSKTVTITTVTTTTVTPELTNGFYVKTQVVLKGNTVWGISKQNYGTGLKWRDIVAQNPFLNAPGRVYYNESKKMWIVIIYPGEVLKLGGEVINPTYVVEVTKTTTTIKEKPAVMPVAPWWGGLLLLLVIAGIVALFYFLFRNDNNSSNSLTSSSNSNSSSAVHVDIRDNAGIDLATRTTLLGREQDFQDHALNILSDSAKKNQLSRLFIEKNENLFVMSAKFFNHHGRDEKPADQKADQTKEGK